MLGPVTEVLVREGWTRQTVDVESVGLVDEREAGAQESEQPDGEVGAGFEFLSRAAFGSARR